MTTREQILDIYNQGPEAVINELEDELPNQQVVNADESSYPHNKNNT